MNNNFILINKVLYCNFFKLHNGLTITGTCSCKGCNNDDLLCYYTLDDFMISKINTNDKTWAIQNLQSNILKNKLTAQYILSNNNNL